MPDDAWLKATAPRAPHPMRVAGAHAQKRSRNATSPTFVAKETGRESGAPKTLVRSKGRCASRRLRLGSVGIVPRALRAWVDLPIGTIEVRSNAISLQRWLVLTAFGLKESGSIG